MDRNITNLTKFGCCVLIFFHHFFVLEDFACTWGRIACAVFFFLSSYGICKSQQKNNYTFIAFFKKRLSRIYIPYVTINLVFIIGGALLLKGLFIIPQYKLVGHEIGFVDDFSIVTAFYYLIGLLKIDGAMWFIDVLLLSYIFIWLIGKISDRRYRIPVIIIVPITLLFLDRICNTHICLWPTDVIGIITGVLFFEYEKEVGLRIKAKYNLFLLGSIFLFLLCVYLYTTLKDSEMIEWKYMEMLILAYSFFSICIVLSISLVHKCKYPKVCTFMGGVSFFVYLLHIKVINVLNYYNFVPLLLYSILFVSIMSIIMYLLDNRIQKALWKK